MSINKRCPKCGSYMVQLSDERSKHGCFWFLVFGIFYLIWIPIKWCIGLLILLLFDWWMALINALCDKGYVWKSKGWFTLTKKIYYCHDCGYNFRA
mgnify:FL=1